MGNLRERQCCRPGVGHKGPALLLVGNPDGGLKVGRLLWTVLHPLLFCCCVFGLLLLHLLLLRIFTAPSLVTSHPFSFNLCRLPPESFLIIATESRHSNVDAAVQPHHSMISRKPQRKTMKTEKKPRFLFHLNPLHIFITSVAREEISGKKS